jgi:hypothetical protein
MMTTYLTGPGSLEGGKKGTDRGEKRDGEIGEEKKVRKREKEEREKGAMRKKRERRTEKKILGEKG